MEIKSLNERLSVTGQIFLSDLSHIKADGFQTIINNRPDNEAPDQPTGEALSKAAAHQGLNYYHIPIIPEQITAQNIADFKHIFETTPGKILAFCRSGARSTALWERR